MEELMAGLMGESRLVLAVGSAVKDAAAVGMQAARAEDKGWQVAGTHYGLDGGHIDMESTWKGSKLRLRLAVKDGLVGWIYRLPGEDGIGDDWSMTTDQPYDSAWMTLVLDNDESARTWNEEEWVAAADAYKSDVENAVDDLLEGLTSSQWFVAAKEQLRGDNDSRKAERQAFALALLDVAIELAHHAHEIDKHSRDDEGAQG